MNELSRLPFDTMTPEQIRDLVVAYVDTNYAGNLHIRDNLLMRLENQDSRNYEYNDPTILEQIIKAFDQQLINKYICRTMNVCQEVLIHFCIHHLDGPIAYINYHTSYEYDSNNILIHIHKTYIVRINDMILPVCIAF
jgi:hypothetical protein